MKFATPSESRKRKKMKLANGIKVTLDDSYEKFDEDEFKKHLAALIEASDDAMIPTPTNLDEHSSGSDGMDQPARKTHIDPTKEEIL